MRRLCLKELSGINVTEDFTAGVQRKTAFIDRNIVLLVVELFANIGVLLKAVIFLRQEVRYLFPLTVTQKEVNIFMPKLFPLKLCV